MAFKITKKSKVLHADPESLFRDLRNRSVEGLLSQQADMLRNYLPHKDQADVSLELPTGSGKTLVGLLIAEWQRTRQQKPSLFLCPTKQLVNQVVEQAKRKYGIDVVSFTGSKSNYSADAKSKFLNCEAVGVTTYSSLFNINPFFDNVGTVIFDDAHAAENYVASCWSVVISQSEAKQINLFSALVGLIEQDIPEHDRVSFQGREDSPLDSQWVNHLPLSKFLKHKEKLIEIFDEYADDAEISYQWNLLRANLSGCLLFYTNNSFLLRPLIPPTQSFIPFTSAVQRVYMSATLGEGADVERLFGRPNICRLSAPEGWEKQGIGRRFFLFPMRSLDEGNAKDFSIALTKKFKRSVVIVPSKPEAGRYTESVVKFYEPDQIDTFSSDQIEKSKDAFVVSQKAVAVLANRYDGIDFNGEESRFLVISGLPVAANLQERFLMSRMAANSMFTARIRSRVTQAVGRCTRSSTDWALVLVIGEAAHKYFMTPENRSRIHPELQAEIEFGIEQSSSTENQLIELIDSFIAQDSDWGIANEHIIQERNDLSVAPDPVATMLGSTVSDEIRYANSMWNADWDSAISSATNVASALNGEKARGYRAWWYYLAANAAYLNFESSKQVQWSNKASVLYSQAAGAVPSLAWLKQLALDDLTIEYPQDDPQFELAEILERIESQFERLGKANSRKLEAKFKEISDGLTSINSSNFESAQVLLGSLLGYIAENSDENSAPDPWWVLLPGKGLVFEDYTEITSDNPRIGKGKIIQAKGHLDWLKVHRPGVQFSVIFCSSAEIITPDSLPFTGGIFYVSSSKMQNFSDKAIKVLRKLWDCYTGVAEISWRTSAYEILRSENLLPQDVLDFFSEVELSELPSY